MKVDLKFVCTVCALATSLSGRAVDMAWNEPNAANPIVPGYFADPTIRKFGDWYYIYATTDGTGGGFGPSQVWVSKDLEDWTIMPMNWPTTHWIWAPDVFKEKDKYYFLYCQPCTLHMGEADTPRGPWTNVLGEEDAVLVPDRFVHNAITLDGQHFRDDDGSIYFYFGTWGIYKGFGCGVAKLNADMKTFSEKKLIENTEITDFFEAPFVLKRNGIYYFTYSSGSCHDHTYRVQYATSTEGPMGPFTYRGCILESNEDRTVDGPGHHSILEEDGKYYILYHRHDNPHSTRGMHRQLCMDELVFEADGSIRKVEPTHDGVHFNKKKTVYPDLAFDAQVTASSYYNNTFHPRYAVDNNNATLWRPESVGQEWLLIDLGKTTHVEQVQTQWEYGTSYYCYQVEASVDGLEWTVVADRSKNRLAGSPMVDYMQGDYRYVRIHFLHQENNGMPGAIWNVKVFGGVQSIPPQQWIGTDALFLENGVCANSLGMLGGSLKTTSGAALVRSSVGGKEALTLKAGDKLVSSAKLPGVQTGKKSVLSEYTVSFQYYANGAWHQAAQVLRGGKVSRMVDGAVVTALPVQVTAVSGAPLQVTAGASDLTFTNVRMYSWAQEAAELAFDANSNLEHKEPTAYQTSDTRAGELLVLDAADYKVGDQLTVIQNSAGGKDTVGDFTTEGAPVGVVLKEGKQAFEFTGMQQFRSQLGLPSTMLGNAPYTVTAWVYNPKVEANECILNLVPTRGENNTMSFGNGSAASNGVISHCGSFEDRGDARVQQNEGKWAFWAVVFDGYMESLYINGERVSKKDIVQLLSPSEYVTLGKNFDGEWPFAGYIRRISLYDTPLSATELQQEAKKAKASDVLFRFDATTDASAYVRNEGVWGGTCTSAATERVVSGRLTETSALLVNDLKGSGAAEVALGVVLEKGKLTQNLLTVAGKDANTLLGVSLHKGTVDVNGTQFRTSDGDALDAGYHEVVLQKEESSTAVYIDGVKAEAVGGDAPAWPDFRGAQQVQVLPGNGVKCGVTSCTVRSKKSDAAALQAQYGRQTAEVVGDVSFGAEALTPDLLSLSAQNADGSVPVLYRYTAGNCSTGWIQDTSYVMPVDASASEVKLEARNTDGRVLGSKIYKVKGILSKQSFVTTSIADGMSVFSGSTVRTQDAEKRMSATFQDGALTLASAGCNFAIDGVENGPFVYKELTGDFVVQARVSDFLGRADRTSPAYNEGGVMVLASTPQNRGKAQTGLHVGVFPYYNQGNIFTHLYHGRMQSSNGQGWDYDPWMQIERRGDVFYIRSSKDGKTWSDVPGSPVSRPDLRDRTLKVGFYQVTYTDAYGTMTFDSGTIYQRK